jgi:hypothetical protein
MSSKISSGIRFVNKVQKVDIGFKGEMSFGKIKAKCTMIPLKENKMFKKSSSNHKETTSYKDCIDIKSKVIRINIGKFSLK